MPNQVDTVLFVHGYSVRVLNSWGRLPSLLQADGFAAADIYIAAFVSLDDYVTCDDLAAALELQIAALEKTPGFDLRRTALIVHSTGAIITRRWLLNRRKAGGTMPSHFVSCAGANHGSTLAQLGRTELAYAFRSLTEHTDVGKRVLEDLDYGSDFLLTLNEEWFDAWNGASPLWSDTFCFSFGGTDHSFWQNHLTWQTREPGSDGTVRISGANLNYRFVDVAPPYNGWSVRTMAQPAPHLVVETLAKRYSHTSESATDKLGLVMSSAANIVSQITHFGMPPEAVSSTAYGILEGIVTRDERPYVALKEAFAVQTAADYQRVAGTWKTETDTWTAANPVQTCSTIVVAIADGVGRIVDDSVVFIQDRQGTIANIAQSVQANQPMRNAVRPSVMSFYVNTQSFEQSHPHKIHAEARSDTPYVDYGFQVDGELSGGNEHVIAPNETTYVRVSVLRDSAKSFEFYNFADPRLAGFLNTPYPPFPV